MTIRDKADAIAEQAWVRLTARLAMILLPALLTMGLPLLSSYLDRMSRGIEEVRSLVVALREEVRVGQAQDAGRFATHQTRLEGLEQRISRLEEAARRDRL